MIGLILLHEYGADIDPTHTSCIPEISSRKKKLEVSGIKDVRFNYKQNWVKHLEKVDNTRLPKHALKHKPRG